MRTVFNILGPLSNPAAATMQLLGVYDKELAGTMAEVLSNLGVTRALPFVARTGWMKLHSPEKRMYTKSVLEKLLLIRSHRNSSGCPDARLPI